MASAAFGPLVYTTARHGGLRDATSLHIDKHDGCLSDPLAQLGHLRTTCQTPKNTAGAKMMGNDLGKMSHHAVAPARGRHGVVSPSPLILRGASKAFSRYPPMPPGHGSSTGEAARTTPALRGHPTPVIAPVDRGRPLGVAALRLDLPAEMRVALAPNAPSCYAYSCPLFTTTQSGSCGSHTD